MQALSAKNFENPYQWLFLDLNSYFASVEQQDNPSLRGKPIAVLPLMSDSTCAIAASQEAKRYGIKTGTKIYDAKRICPSLLCVPARHDLYVAYHHKILSEIIKHTPINKICSIDELSSRLPPNKRSKEAATALALRIKDGIRRNVGEHITCSIGVAPNAFLAKIATDMQKPDGLVILDHETWPARLFDLRLTDLPGINTRMDLRLFKAGIHSVKTFWSLSPKHARAVWGSVAGERFWYQLHGYDIPDQPTHRSMVGHSRVLDPDLRALPAARLVARRLTVKAASRLRRINLHAGGFYFSARTTDGRRFADQYALSPTQDAFAFLESLGRLWDRMESLTGRHVSLQKVSVSLYDLHKKEEITGDLFTSAPEKPQRQEKRNEKIIGAMEAINRKFGSDSISLGPTPKTSAGYVGTKIAFNRIPDMEEFYE